MKQATWEAINRRPAATATRGQHATPFTKPTFTKPLYSTVVTGGHQATSFTNSSHQPTPQPPPFNETATHAKPGQLKEKEALNDGWTYVTRRKVHRHRSERQDRPKLNKHLESLKAQGRCYRCLDRGHIKLQCRNSVKCINCHGYGHISKRCTLMKNQPINTPRTSSTTTKHNPQPLNIQPTPSPQAVPSPTTTLNPPSPTQHRPTMDYENWKTMPMLSPDLLQVKAPELRVFFAPNDNINSQNLSLDRFTIVLLGPRADRVNQLPQRVATTIATTFGCPPEELKSPH
ncbi:hypothetical protein FCM35_KLT04993 [Carex littledalei]|uniref:CCHC-type domain-containing protein n=1 Tax=Carex littledalei TaxID=544730 RepID=A0A833QZK1_9POAL|nr:hypothetical protein FCM35_KLT04993 [Carex littledalei]